jgi:hypothetical protein
MKKFSYDLPKDLYNGMRVRPTMDTIVNDVIKGSYRIKYPNRDATFYLNSPQFLSLLQDTNVGLAEQSKQLEKQKIREAELKTIGKGGVVDTAAMGASLSGSSASSGVGGLQETSPETLRRMNREARVRRLREEMANQEEDRREREDGL